MIVRILPHGVDWIFIWFGMERMHLTIVGFLVLCRYFSRGSFIKSSYAMTLVFRCFVAA